MTDIQASIATQASPASPMTFDVPTTKILAIGSLTDKATPDAVAATIFLEVRATVRLFLAGWIDQWFSQTSGTGVVFIMNVTTEADALAILEALPLGVAGLMEFHLIQIGPLRPLAKLLGDQ
jgi:hypothetical protein